MNEEAIFHAATQKTSPEERAAYLNEACYGDADLRAGVEALLDAYDHPDSFLDAPVAGLAADYRHARHRRAAGPDHRPLQAPGGDRRGGDGRGLHGRAAGAGPPQGGPEDHQAGHGHPAGDRPLRGRAAGPGADGPPQHRPGARRGGDRVGPALFRDGTGPGHPHHGVLRPEPAHRPDERLELFVSGLPGRAARPSEGDHPSRPQAVQRDGHALRRRAGPQDHRLRHRQGHPSAAHREDALHRLRPDDRHAAVHEPGAGRDERLGRGHPQRHLLAGRVALRAADRQHAVRPRAAARGRLRRNPPHDPRGGAAAAEHSDQHAGRGGHDRSRRTARRTPASSADCCAATWTGS